MKPGVDPLSELLREVLDSVDAGGASLGPGSVSPRTPAGVRLDYEDRDRHYVGSAAARRGDDPLLHAELGAALRQALEARLAARLLETLGESPAGDAALLARLRELRAAANAEIDAVVAPHEARRRAWARHKLVLESRHCVTLDRVPEALRGVIADNRAQRRAWVDLFGVEDSGAPLDDAFVRAHPGLTLDTRHFDVAFRDALLEALGDLDAELGGLMVHGDNAHALRLLAARYAGEIEVVYIDPPYNTHEDGFVYKNQFRRSSWLAMMHERILLSRALLGRDGVHAAAIDDAESARLRLLLDEIFGEDNHVATFAIEVNPAGQNLRPNVPARSHDYCHVHARELARTSVRLRPLTVDERRAYPEEDERGRFYWDNLRRRGGNSRPADRPGQWFALFADLASGRVDLESFPGASEVWPVDPRGERRIWRVNPKGARREIDAGEIGVIERAGRVTIVKKSRMPQGRKPKTLWSDPAHSATTHGTRLLGEMLDATAFTYPKSLHLVRDIVGYWSSPGGVVLDAFAGSGTTAHAVIELNRQDGGRRRFVLVEGGAHFDTVTLPRVLKATFAREWRARRPVDRDGTSALYQVLRLETYEDALDAGLGDFPLTAAALRDPFCAEITLVRRGESRRVPVDVVETFSLLLGLRVRRRGAPFARRAELERDARGGLRVRTGTLRPAPQGQGLTFQVIEGDAPGGERVRVVWRTLGDDGEAEAAMLEALFEAGELGARGPGVDVLYVHGESDLLALRRADERFELVVIEPALRRLLLAPADQRGGEPASGAGDAPASASAARADAQQRKPVE